MTDSIQDLHEKIDQLEEQLRKSEKIRQVLMDRVENNIANSTGAFAMFENNIVLQQQVRRRTEALRENEERFRQIFHTLNIGIMMIDQETHIIEDVNAAACDLIEKPREAILGNICHAFVCPAERNACPITDLGQQIDNSERILIIAGDERIPILKSVQSITLSGRKYLIESLVDLRAQKKTEEALKKAKDASEEASRLKSEFLANMSHEIRTPMNGVIGMAELLVSTRLTREQKEYVQAIRSSSESLMTIINDILDFSKIEAKRLDIESIDFNLRDGIGDTLQALMVKATEKGLELAYQVAPEIPEHVLGDPGRLRQILINLVGNSIKFTEHGEVVVTVAMEAKEENEIVLRFSITDTGIGIPAEKRAKIFDAFSQVDASTTRKYGGTGLGLTICGRLVELMGGKIWLESEVGVGTSFHFTALLGISSTAPPRIVPSTLASIRGLRVLVVDDNATNRRIMKEILNNWQLDPATAENGPEALDMLRTAAQSEKPFGLMLLDMNMPMMDGFALADVVRNHMAHRDLPIMLLTSSGMRGEGVKCREIGISAYLTKPVKQSTLLDAILNIFGNKELEDTGPMLITQHSLRETEMPLRILLAEDNVINQRIAVGMLSKRGHEVVKAENGREVLAVLEKGGGEPFDVILMDIQMPVMDGLETTRRIREREKRTGAHIPIIAVTAHAMKGDREACIAAGMDAYVSKPIRGEEFHAAMKEALSRKEVEAPSDNVDDTGEADVFSLEQTMRTLDDDQELFREIIGMFLENYPEYMEEIRRAIDHKNAEALNHTAHALKGTAANFGAEKVVATALRLEKMGESGDLEDASTAYEELEREILRLRVAFENYLKS